MPGKNLLSNEATSVDLAVYDALKDLGWVRGKTLHYQRSFALTPEQQQEFPGLKSIKPDFVLTDLQDTPVAVIENKETDPAVALTKLRLLYSRVLRPRFLYACVADPKTGALKIHLLDMEWTGLDIEFRSTTTFHSLDAVGKEVALAKQRKRSAPIKIDTSIAGGYDPAAGKDRYYQLECIKLLIELFKAGKQKMLVHMATGLGKTRTLVAFVRALFDAAFAKRVLFVVDRRMLARQARDKGFALISGSYNSAWITSGSLKSHAGKDIHIVVIDTLENIFQHIPPNYYDLLIVDECHRSITLNRKLIFDHFLCPRIGLTATPRVAIPADTEDVDPADLAIADTYKLFGCESGAPDYVFDLDRGITEGFLAPYTKDEILTELTKQAMAAGILYDHLLDPTTRERINLTEEQEIALEKLNKRILSEEQARRWAEELNAKTEYGEKVIVFAASQAHAQMLVKEINATFKDQTKEGYRYAEAVISENDELNEVIKNSFERPYQNPRIVVSVDIMSTGVDVPCVRYIAFCAITKSVGKYIQMLGRGTRLDPKTGKYSFKVLDFVGLCKKMDDNGRGSPMPNEKVVKPGAGGGGGGGGGGTGPGRVDGILDNPDPAHLIQRTTIIEGVVKVIDNIPVDLARQLFETGVKGAQDPLIAEITRKVWEHKDYEPTGEELAAIRAWIAKPEIYLTETQLQRIYGFPAGSVWDFFLAVLGVRTIPTKAEQLESGFEQFLKLYPFTTEQIAALTKIKNILAANIDAQGRIDLDAIFANPIYSRLLGRFEEINKLFEGRLREVFGQLSDTFRKSA